MLNPSQITSEKMPDGSISIKYMFDLEGEARSIFDEVVSQKDTLIEKRVLDLLSEHYGYIKPVRCKDCVYYQPTDSTIGECSITDGYFYPTDFCSSALEG